MPVPFAGDSSLTLSNGTKIQLKSKFVTNGTLPVGGTWQTLPIPSTSQLGMQPKGTPRTAFQFDPPCYEPTLPTGLAQGRCSGEWTPNVSAFCRITQPAARPRPSPCCTPAFPWRF